VYYCTATAAFTAIRGGGAGRKAGQDGSRERERETKKGDERKEKAASLDEAQTKRKGEPET